MNYGELRAHFLDVLNRTDCTLAQANTFISMGLRRTERLLRTPIQKTVLELTVDDTWNGFLMIPSDYIGFYSISVNGVPVPRIVPSQLGMMNGFIVEHARFTFQPDLKPGDELKLIYYNEFTQAPPDDSIVDYSLVLPDLITYAALVFACDTFVDERKATFEGTLTALVQEVQTMSDQEEMSGGGAITPYGGGII
jgi:hypothetical protein